MLARARALYTEFVLRAGSLVLICYAIAGGLVGIEIFAFLAVWPLGVALLVAALVAGRWAWRRTDDDRMAP